jgi:hypothetical protein
LGTSMAALLFLMLQVVYGALAYFIYDSLILNRRLKRKTALMSAITVYGAIVQHVAVRVLDYRGDIRWVIEPYWGFYRIVNRELLLSRLLREDFGIEIGLAFLSSIDGGMDFLARYAGLFVLVALMLLPIEDRNQKTTVWLLALGSMIVDLSASLAHGWGSHDFNALSFTSGSETIRLVGDVKDIFVQSALLCFLLAAVRTARRNIAAARAEKISRESTLSPKRALSDEKRADSAHEGGLEN